MVEQTEEEFGEAMHLTKDVTRVFYAFRQNRSRVFARDFGKKRCAHPEAGGHTVAYTIPYPPLFSNVL